MDCIKYGIHPPSIRQALELYLEPGQVTELRVPKAKVQGEWKRGTYSGYFDREHIDEFIHACEQIEVAAGVYFIPNPIKPEVLARRMYEARIVGDEPLTGDSDILERRWLLIDIDPSRVSGISSADEEKQVAYEIITAIDCELWGRGFPPGIIADSGNGWHLTIPCKLPANDGGYCEKFLKGLAKRFDYDTAAKVDITVFNPARIWKLPGTLACKGSNAVAIGRPWRMAKIKTVCTEVPSDA